MSPPPGELTWQVPFELADAVLEDTRTRERRLRELPSWVGSTSCWRWACSRGWDTSVGDRR